MDNHSQPDHNKAAAPKDSWEWDEASLSTLAEEDPAAFWALVDYPAET